MVSFARCPASSLGVLQRTCSTTASGRGWTSWSTRWTTSTPGPLRNTACGGRHPSCARRPDRGAVALAPRQLQLSICLGPPHAHPTHPHPHTPPTHPPHPLQAVRRLPLCVLLQAAAGERHAGPEMQHPDGHPPPDGELRCGAASPAFVPGAGAGVGPALFADSRAPGPRARPATRADGTPLCSS